MGVLACAIILWVMPILLWQLCPRVLTPPKKVLSSYSVFSVCTWLGHNELSMTHTMVVPALHIDQCTLHSTLLICPSACPLHWHLPHHAGAPSPLGPRAMLLQRTQARQGCRCQLRRLLHASLLQQLTTQTGPSVLAGAMMVLAHCVMTTPPAASCRTHRTTTSPQATPTVWRTVLSQQLMCRAVATGSPVTGFAGGRRLTTCDMLSLSSEPTANEQSAVAAVC
jgi:hypothetical protein